MTGFIQGDNTEAKFASIERALQRLSRKSVKKVGIEIPPSPVSEFKESPNDDGTIMRYMFGVQGRIIRSLIWVENFPENKKRVPIMLDIETSEHNASQSFEITPKLNNFVIEMDVEAGSRFTLRLADPLDAISGIWISFLYQIRPNSGQLQEMLVKHIEDGVESLKNA